MTKIPGMALHWTPTKIVVANPTVATEYGTYAESYDTPQGKASDGGNYVVIWNKINGKWRVALDAPNTTDPLPSPPAKLRARQWIHPRPETAAKRTHVGRRDCAHFSSRC